MPDFFLHWDTQKSVKYISASKINARAEAKQRLRSRSRWHRERIFLIFIKGWSRLKPR
jgi:hypothetical protein